MKRNIANLVKVKEVVAERVTPDHGERSKVEKIVHNLLRMISEAVEVSGLESEITLEGSVAKDTWLSEEADVDVFLQIPSSRDRQYLESNCMDTLRRTFEKFHPVERYAEHPYLEASIEGVRVNVVPCFKVDKGRWMSAADRTPFHTGYMKKRLTEPLREEVRILKRFMKGCNFYGAEVKVRGFSGFLCELLTLHYKSFEDIMAASSTWRKRELIDVENYYHGKERDALKLFPEPLIAVDPVDQKRNAAAAVAEETMWNFVSASRLILEKPRLTFFYPQPLKSTRNRLQKEMKGYQGDLVAVDIGEVDAIVDVVWSQLFKTERILKTLLKKEGFTVIRSESWSNKKNYALILFHLESHELPYAFKHVGPFVELAQSSDQFMARYVDASDTISGPWIDTDRWFVEKNRTERSAVHLLEKMIQKGNSSYGIPSRIFESLQKESRILINQEVLTLTAIPGVAEEIYRFIRGRPMWLEAAL